MANFHSNVVAFAASEKDMFGVLMTMAKNLAAHEDNPLDMKEIEAITTADELYDAIASELECYYFCMFTPNPEGRGLSDTADVEYKRRGTKRVLCLNYSTAWEMNWEDLAEFSGNLPDGEYGIAVYDADEADDYAEINQTVYVIKVGAGDIDDTYTEEGCLSRSELKTLQKETPSLGRAKTKGMGLDGMANIVAVKSWYEWGSEDEWDSEDEDDEDAGESSEASGQAEERPANQRADESGQGGAGDSADPDVSELYDDNVRHNLIPMLVLSRKLSGHPLPEDLEADATRFANDDDSVDVQDLYRRLEPYLGASVPAVDYASVTFDAGRMAEGPDFSVPVPDGWVLATQGDELRNDDHPFEIRPTELTPEESVSTDVDELSYGVTPSSDPGTEALFAEVGIPELRRAVLFQGMADLARKGQGLVSFCSIYDEQAERATCLVLQTEAQAPGHLAFRIYPLYATGSDCLFCDLRVTDGDDGEGACQEFIKKLACGIKIHGDPRPAVERRLDAPWAGRAEEVIADFARLADAYAKSWENLLDDDTVDAFVGKGTSEYDVCEMKHRLLSGKVSMSDAMMPAFGGYLDKLEEAVRDGMDQNQAVTLLELIVQVVDVCSSIDDDYAWLLDGRASDLPAPELFELWDKDSHVTGVFAHAMQIEEELGVPGTVEEIVAEPWRLRPAKERAKEMAKRRPAAKRASGKKTPAKATAAKKTTTAKKTATKKPATAEKASATKKSTATKATTAKTTTAKKATPAKATATKKATTAETTGAKMTAAKKASTTKKAPTAKATEAKATGAKKTATAKTAAAKTEVTAKKVATTKTAAAKKTTPAKATVAKKASVTKTSVAKKTAPTPEKKAAGGPMVVQDSVSASSQVDVSEVSEMDERDGLLALLRLTVDARAQEGKPCPEELVQELARAEAGDASVDVDQLASRLADKKRRMAKPKPAYSRTVWTRPAPPEVLAARAEFAKRKKALSDMPGAPDQATIDELDARVRNLEHELANTNIFQIGRRRELLRQIDEMRSRLVSARRLRLQRASAEHDVDAAREKLRRALHDAGIERLFKGKDA